MYPKLKTFIEDLDTSSISQERKEILQPLERFIQHKIRDNEPVKLNFICTHNSRRSQLGQIWAGVLANYYGMNIETYSGGVEVTAFNPRAIASLERTGFTIQKQGESNPVYSVFYDSDKAIANMFSKNYDSDTNPSNGFAAIMTCSHADGNCPFIAGAEKRIPITYEDPKAFDDSPQESEMYDERSKQIATEMKFIFSQINL